MVMGSVVGGAARHVEHSSVKCMIGAGIDAEVAVGASVDAGGIIGVAFLGGDYLAEVNPRAPTWRDE